MPYKFSPLSLAILAIINVSAHAQATDTETAQSLPTITIQAPAEQKENEEYAAKTASSVLRSNDPLFETAQSISVVTSEQIQEKQLKTVAEALEGVAGVASGSYGRRGWDDFIIRGQISSAQTYVDGLRVQTSTNVLRSEDISGLDSIRI